MSGFLNEHHNGAGRMFAGQVGDDGGGCGCMLAIVLIAALAVYCVLSRFT